MNVQQRQLLYAADDDAFLSSCRRSLVTGQDADSSDQCSMSGRHDQPMCVCVGP